MKNAIKEVVLGAQEGHISDFFGRGVKNAIKGSCFESSGSHASLMQTALKHLEPQ